MSGGPQATIDPFLLSLTIIVHPKSTPEMVIEALETEIQKLQDTAPDPNELHRALKQARALFSYGSERITNQAFWLGFSAMIADHSWYENYLDRLGAVTPEDVQHVGPGNTSARKIASWAFTGLSQDSPKVSLKVSNEACH